MLPVQADHTEVHVVLVELSEELVRVVNGGVLFKANLVLIQEFRLLPGH